MFIDDKKMHGAFGLREKKPVQGEFGIPKTDKDHNKKRKQRKSKPLLKTRNIQDGYHYNRFS
jgi:hypothetical protein